MKWTPENNGFSLISYQCVTSSIVTNTFNLEAVVTYFLIYVYLRFSLKSFCTRVSKNLHIHMFIMVIFLFLYMCLSARIFSAIGPRIIKIRVTGNFNLLVFFRFYSKRILCPCLCPIPFPFISGPHFGFKSYLANNESLSSYRGHFGEFLLF